jgi:hypothetical protein
VTTGVLVSPTLFDFFRLVGVGLVDTSPSLLVAGAPSLPGVNTILIRVLSIGGMAKQFGHWMVCQPRIHFAMRSS